MSSENSTKRNVIVKIALFVLFAVFYAGYRYNYFYEETVDGAFFRTVIFKALSSACFVFFAVWNFFASKEKSAGFKRYSIKIILALVFSLVADVFIKYNIVTGILGFLLAQICFFLAFTEFKKPSLKYALLVFAVVCAILIFDWFCPLIALEKLFVPLAAYSVFVVGSALKSVDALSFKNTKGRLVVTAGVLFLISDFSLQFSVHEVCKLSWAGDQIMNNFSNVTYYAAQLLFAHSLSQDFFEVDNI